MDKESPHPSNHTLNTCLAEVAGVSIREGSLAGEIYWLVMVDGVEDGEWTPLTDHNQMALVKAGLRWSGDSYAEYWDPARCLHYVDLMPKNSEKDLIVTYDPDELRTLALAIWQMKKGEDNDR